MTAGTKEGMLGSDPVQREDGCRVADQLVGIKGSGLECQGS